MRNLLSSRIISHFLILEKRRAPSFPPPPWDASVVIAAIRCLPVPSRPEECQDSRPDPYVLWVRIGCPARHVLALERKFLRPFFFSGLWAQRQLEGRKTTGKVLLIP